MKIIILLTCLFSTNGFLIGRIKPLKHSLINMQLEKPVEILQKFQKLGVDSSWTVKELMENIDKNRVDGASLLVKDNIVNGLVAIDNNYKDVIERSNLHLVRTGVPELTENVIKQLDSHHINYDIFYQGNNFLSSAFSTGVNIALAYLLISAFFSFLRNRGMGGMGGMGSPFTQLQNNIELVSVDTNITTRFSDVAGCDEAKYELEEIVEFLKNPKVFVDAGAKIPKGVLLEGPPGTGKTLLARAVAGEAKVSFIPATGSQFIEMFVGVGASRVRKLFDLAKENTPCVIFIDEIDAIGRQRGTGFNSGNDEREQTLNQILTNMDGFSKETGIIVLGATNRVDILDSALVRSGRFDRKVKVGLPDDVGRKAILKVHLRNKEIEKDVDLDEMAVLTSGFSGADLETLANEAIILSLRDNKTKISRDKFLDAFEKTTIGLPQSTETREDKLIELVAYHEAGHALIASLFNSFYDVRKVTINSNKGGAGGYTLFTAKDRYNMYPTKKFILSKLLVALGGRAAEIFLYNRQVELNSDKYEDSKLFNGIKDLEITTGASNDLKQADSLARNYIQLFGYNNSLLLQDRDDTSQPFLGRTMAMQSSGLSEYAKSEIDRGVKELVDYANNMALKIVEENEEAMDLIAQQLIKNRTIDSKFLEKLDIRYN